MRKARSYFLLKFKKALFKLLVFAKFDYYSKVLLSEPLTQSDG